MRDKERQKEYDEILRYTQYNSFYGNLIKHGIPKMTQVNKQEEMFPEEIPFVAKNKAMHQGKAATSKKSSEERTDDIYRTPISVIEDMFYFAEIDRPFRALDPFAGDNRIMSVVHREAGSNLISSVSVEINPEEDWVKVPRNTYCITDFYKMLLSGKPFDLIIMNPPFSELGYHSAIDKILKEGWLHKDGIIITVTTIFYLCQSMKRKPFLDRHLRGIQFINRNTFQPAANAIDGCICKLGHERPLKDPINGKKYIESGLFIKSSLDPEQFEVW
jgi:hypothetical protein